MGDRDTTTVRVYGDTWDRLSEHKTRSDTFDDVINDALDALETEPAVEAD